MAVGRDWFSTAGPAVLGEEDEEPQGAVVLERTNAPLAQGLPELVQLGGAGFATVVNMGKHEDNAVILQLEGASNVQCQFALRTFRLPEQDQVHQALFLRDVSSRGTLVNGVFAFRPWHWLQEGDAIGIHAADGTQDMMHMYTTRYRDLRRLPASMVLVEDNGPFRLAQPGGDQRGQHHLGHVGQHTLGHMGVPPLAPLADVAPSGFSRSRGAGFSQGRGPYRGGAVAYQGRRVVRRRRNFGPEVCGRIVDLRYPEWPNTYRVRVVKFDGDHGHHRVHSRGLSTWDDESFEDEIDLNNMYENGDVTFVDGSGASSEEPSEQRRPNRKRGRPRR